MNVVTRLAWRNLWRPPRRSWLTIGAMVFSNAILVFMISLQFGMYELMIDNTLQSFTGHMQVQAPGYKDDAKMRQVVPEVAKLAADLRRELGTEKIAARAAAFALASSEERSYGLQVIGVDPEYEPQVSTIPGLGAGAKSAYCDRRRADVARQRARRLVCRRSRNGHRHFRHWHDRHGPQHC